MPATRPQSKTTMVGQPCTYRVRAYTDAGGGAFSGNVTAATTPPARHRALKQYGWVGVLYNYMDAKRRNGAACTHCGQPAGFGNRWSTVKLRLEMDNPKFGLRPEMLVDVELPITMPASVTLPVDALVDSGTSSRVYVERSEGIFEPREVQTGWRFDDRVEIRSGVEPGELWLSRQLS